MASPKELLAKLNAMEDRGFALAAPYLLLIIRLVVGYAMFRAGYGKLTNLDRTTYFFGEIIGLPAPKLNAIMVACAEMSGGLLFMCGLLTRFAAGMITVVLLVALLSYEVHREELGMLFKNPGAVVASAPVPYIITYLLVGISGPGRFSLDRLIFGQSGES